MGIYYLLFCNHIYSSCTRYLVNIKLLSDSGSVTFEVREGEWMVGDCLAQWWRPNFETFMYPFVPAHVTRPKECKKLYYIQLPEAST